MKYYFWILALTLSASIACTERPVYTTDLSGKAKPANDDDSKPDPDEDDINKKDDDIVKDDDDIIKKDDPTDDVIVKDPVEEPKKDEPKKEEPKKEPVLRKSPNEAANRDGNLPDITGYPDFNNGQVRAQYLLSRAAGVPQGKMTRDIKFSSVGSKYFDGRSDKLSGDKRGDFERNVSVYTPPNYNGTDELPFMVVGDSYGMDLFQVVAENLIAQKRLPPMAFVFISPGVIGGHGDGPGSERSFEYDSCSDRFANYVDNEILPELEKKVKIKFTKNPAGRGAAGISSSGAMAFTMAWFKNDSYQRVLTYSGTFVNRITSEGFDKGAYDYHSGKKVIKNSPKKNLRVVLQVGERDNNFTPDVTNNWITANPAMADVFKEKGVPYRYVFAKDAVHVDGRVVNLKIAEDLEWLWLDYPIP
ncbi:MAG: hypothetical protein EOP10_11620 [Proteobacteria bacterium]|nr:MAG: hypothetical protein EOP10_11620 [Pseudomonadota bacterium]